MTAKFEDGFNIQRGHAKNNETFARDAASKRADLVSRLSGGASKLRLDATTEVFQRELESIDARVWETLRQPLLMSNVLTINASGVAPEDEFYTWTQADMAGRADFDHISTTQVPFVDVAGEQKIYKQHTAVIAYKYNILEQQASPRLMLNPLERKRTMASEAIDRLFDRMLATGEGVPARTGLFNDGDVNAASLTTGSWATATEAQIYEDLRVLYQSLLTQLNALDQTDPGLAPNTIVLPTSVQAALLKKSVETDGTVLDNVRRHMGFITNVEFNPLLNTAGASNSARVMLMNNGADNVAGIISLPYEERPVQSVAYSDVVYAYGRIVGTVYYRPFTAIYGDGA